MASQFTFAAICHGEPGHEMYNFYVIPFLSYSCSHRHEQSETENTDYVIMPNEATQ